MPNRDIGLVVYSANVDWIIRDLANGIFHDHPDLTNISHPLPASAIGGGFAFPDYAHFNCRRLYACGIFMGMSPIELTAEQIATFRSEEAQDRWW